MSLVDAGSVVLSAGVPTIVDLNKFSENPCEVKIQNESALNLQVTIGNDQHTIGAWMVDKLPLCGKTTLRLLPTQLQNPAPGLAPSASILLTVAPDGERIPGTYPAPLSRMSAAGSIAASGTLSSSVGTGNIPVAGATVIGILTTFTGAMAFRVLGSPDGSVVTGLVALDMFFVGVAGLPFKRVSRATGANTTGLYLVNVAGMSAVQLNYLNGAGSVTYNLFAGPGPLPFWGLGQEVMASSQPVVIASDQSAIPTTQAATGQPPWLAPTSRIALIVGALAAGGTQTLIAGVGGQTIYLFDVELAPDVVGANFVELYTSSTPAAYLWQGQLNALTPRRFGSSPGSPLLVGDGLVLKNDPASAGAVSLRGTVSYSQA